MLSGGLGLLLVGLFHFPGTTSNCHEQCFSHTQNSEYRTAETRALLRTIKSPTFGYERTTRPTFLKSHTSVYIYLGITKITVKNGLFAVDLTVNQRWSDPRLIFAPQRNSCHPAEENISLQEEDMGSIWTPDTFFEKEAFSSKHKGVRPSQSVTIFCDGMVKSRIRLSTTVYCSMVFSAFPHDTHTCSFMISSWAYKTDALIFHWDTNNSRALDSALSRDLEHFVITKMSHYKTESDIPHSGKYSRIIVEFGFKRQPHYFILNFYFPAILVVTASWTSFWIEAKSTTARVQLGIVTVLTTLTLMIKTLDSEQIPNVSALKAIDVYMMVCFLYAFMAFLVYPFVHSLIKHEKFINEEDCCQDNPDEDEGPLSAWDLIFKHFSISPIATSFNNEQEEEEEEIKKKGLLKKVLLKLDKQSRWLFPVSFIVFNVLYFMTVSSIL